MTREDVILTEEQRVTLEYLLSDYKQACDAKAVAEAKQKALNGMIKSTLEDYGITHFRSDSGFGVSMSKTPNVKWDMDGLTEYCKSLGIPNLVISKETVNMDELERQLYNSCVSAEDIKKFQKSVTETVRLNTSTKEMLNE